MRPFEKLLLPLLLPLALLALLAPAAWADDPVPAPAPPPVPTTVDPGWSGPPPAPAPVPDPVPVPPAPESVPVPGSPDPLPPPVPAAPAARADSSHLPPPVVRRAGQPRPTAPASAGTAPYVAPPTYTFPPGAPLPTPDSVALPPTAPLAPLAAASILNVAKHHNIELSDGSLALRLETRFRVDEAVSRSYRVWITFFDRATGTPIQSTKPTFADAQGGLYVLTKPVSSVGGGQEFNAPLTVPYVVFPDPGAGNSTEIEARVELMRVEGASQETPVAASATTFRVHGAPVDAAPAPAVSDFPAPR